MTIDESIEVLTIHKLHWERLLSEGICDAHEGKETIDAFDMAIKGLEAWERVKDDIHEYETDCMVSADCADCKDCNVVMFKSIYQIIDKHLQEVGTQ